MVLKTENAGNDLIVTFNGKGNGITEEEFAPKLIGKYKNGKMLYGYARLPYADYTEPVLSARAPSFHQTEKGWNCDVEIQNFGQVASKASSLKLEYTIDGKKVNVASGNIPALQPYEKTTVALACKKGNEVIEGQDMTITIYSGKKVLSTFELKKDK